MASSPFQSDAMEDPPDPTTPHAAPIVDAEGHLTYIGDDGRRYVVALPPEADGDSVERVMANLRQGDALF